MDTTQPRNARRRTLLKGAAGATGLGLAGGFVVLDAGAQGGRAAVNLQLGWLPGNNQIGEVVAKQLGYFQQEGLDVTIQPGGPSIDGVAIVASGKYELGQVSSSPSLMLAASQDLPIKCFATGLQQHPYTFFSLKKKPVRTAKDMVGKKVGIQATGVILLRALLAKNNVPESAVEIVTIGADMSPLLTGQVDVVTGWQTNVTALKPLGPDRVDLRLWDAGVRLYALPYYATAKTIQTRPDVLQKFLRATARGYAYTNANREAATDLLIKEYPESRACRREGRHRRDDGLRVQRPHQGQRLGHDGSRGVAGADHALLEPRSVHQAHAEAGRSHDHGHPERHPRRARQGVA